MDEINKLKLIKTLMSFFCWLTLGIFIINLLMPNHFGIIIFLISVTFFILYIYFASKYEKHPEYKKEKTSWITKFVKTIIILISILFFFKISFVIVINSSKKYSDKTEDLCSFSSFLIYTENNKKIGNYELKDLDKTLKEFKEIAKGSFSYSFVMPEKSGKIPITTRDGKSTLNYKVIDKTEEYITYKINYSLDDYFVENAYKVFIKENKIIPVYAGCIHAMHSLIFTPLAGILTVLFNYFLDLIIYLVYIRFVRKKS